MRQLKIRHPLAEIEEMSPLQENCKVGILKNRLKKSAKIMITTESRRTRSSFINGSFLRALRDSVVQFFGILLAGCDFVVCLEPTGRPVGNLLFFSVDVVSCRIRVRR
jgi:hypothetical protein